MSDKIPADPAAPQRPSASAQDTAPQSDPYRAPNAVSDSPVVGGMRRPLAWFAVLATTVTVALGAWFLLTPTVVDFGDNRRPVKSLPSYVEDFRATRVLPTDIENFDDNPPTIQTNENDGTAPPP